MNDDVKKFDKKDPDTVKAIEHASRALAVWEMRTEINNSKINSRNFIQFITPEIFIQNYYLFKLNKIDEIVDRIYQVIPIYVMETIINMGLYIFRTRNQLYILEYIINEVSDL